MDQALGILETTGLTPLLVALDAMEKAAPIRVLQAELNDFYGVCVKFVAGAAEVESALAAGRPLAEAMAGRPVTALIRRVDAEAWKGIDSRPEFNPLIQQHVVMVPSYETVAGTRTREDTTLSDTRSQALGFLETQGFTAVFEAVDRACKAANVQVVGKEKLGGGYITIVLQGDVAAVHAAVEAGRTAAEGLGKLIAAHVIARPSANVLALLPKIG